MADTIDQQFIEFIVKALVGNPDAVKVTRTIDEKGVLLELYVDPTDLGRVIGRNGATAKSIRILLRALGVKNDARYNLKIIDTNEGERPPRRDDRDEYHHEEPAAQPMAEPTEPAAMAEPTVEAEQPAEAPAPEPAPEPEPEPQPEAPAEDDIVSRSRKELEDYNDLDI